MLKCRECKHNLTTQLALHMLKVVPQYLTRGKRFIVAGSLRGNLRDKALFIEHGCQIPKTDDRLTCNCEEGYMRVWIHCKYSVGVRKLVFSSRY